MSAVGAQRYGLESGCLLVSYVLRVVLRSAQLSVDTTGILSAARNFCSLVPYPTHYAAFRDAQSSEAVRGAAARCWSLPPSTTAAFCPQQQTGTCQLPCHGRAGCSGCLRVCHPRRAATQHQRPEEAGLLLQQRSSAAAGRHQARAVLSCAGAGQGGGAGSTDMQGPQGQAAGPHRCAERSVHLHQR